MPLLFQLTPPQPDLFVTNVRIAEPITSLTGLCITLLCFWAFFSLKNNKTVGQQPRFHLKWVLLAIGVSNLVSALFGHAFLYQFGMAWKIPGWWLSMVGVALLAYWSIQRSGRLLPAMIKKGLHYTNTVFFVLLAALSAWQLNFKLVEMHAAFCLLLIMLPLELRLWQEDRNPVSGWLILSLVPAFGAVALHIAKFSLSPWFNFFDMGHLLLCGTVYCIWKAADQVTTITSL
jgi:hypothetical protein